jgi:hypothetical protein
MPPKADPYATPAQRRIDAILVIISILAVVFLFLSSSRGHAANDSATPVPTTQNISR